MTSVYRSWCPLCVSKAFRSRENVCPGSVEISRMFRGGWRENSPLFRDLSPGKEHIRPARFACSRHFFFPNFPDRANNGVLRASGGKAQTHEPRPSRTGPLSSAFDGIHGRELPRALDGTGLTVPPHFGREGGKDFGLPSSRLEVPSLKKILVYPVSEQTFPGSRSFVAFVEEGERGRVRVC